MSQLPDDDGDIERLLREQAAGPPSFPDTQPWEWLLQQDDDAVANRVWPVVSRLLVDGDATVRLRALEFVMNWRDKARTEARLFEVATKQKALYADQVVEGTRLRQRLQDAVAWRCLRPGSPGVAVLLGLLDDQPPAPSTSTPIAVADVARAKKIAQSPAASTDWAGGAVAAVALYHRDELLDFLRALVKRNDRDTLAERASRALVRDEAKLRRLLANDGVAAPTGTVPTDAEIRAALMLP